MYTAKTTTVAGGKRFEDTTNYIPPPGYNGVPPEKYDPLLMRLPITLGEPFSLLVLGLGLEIVAGLSQRWNGFRVPLSTTFGLFGNISSQFLASFVPTLLIIPNAVLWRELDWMIRMYQPYLVLAKGDADAERSVLLNYVEIGPILTIPRALKYKHRLVFISALTASLTYLFQPFSDAIFQIRQIPYTRPWTATSIETLARAPDIAELQAFVAGAGYADAAIIHGLGDPKFVNGGWATARFTFPLEPMLNGTMKVKTIGVSTKPDCSNPTSQSIVGTTGSNFNLSATSITGCSYSAVFDPDVPTQQYGVEATPCQGVDGRVDPDPQFQPVMFWFYRRRDDGTNEGRAIFCRQKLVANYVEVVSDVASGNVLSVQATPDIVPENEVTGGRDGGRSYNGVVFPATTNPFIQFRANATNSIVPAAIFRSMSQQQGGLASVFSPDRPNAVLDWTQKIYTQHLAVSSKGVYFVPGNSTLPAECTSHEPRLVVDPFPAHFLASILVFTGIVGMIIHVLHRGQRKKLRLSAEPGTIAAAAALVSRSGWGNLLTPYDGELTMEQKLEGLKFSFDKRTGAIIASTAGHSTPDDSQMSKLPLLDATTPLSSSFAAYQSAAGKEPWKDSSQALK
ncbi:hypothetical protein FA13DRAFT_1636029 [Coprinellus micaceus]|uniref:Uncharacterized protein n=1 Tax=Coprinellus micaceus TaxID=71717 RepID=A0A4Y7SXQ3_COPMI|nr:hypothetical protein FA13DRAFT_1636029 [Coprinellus micaceus]